MAGSSGIGDDGGENPVAVNVTPLVDVIFCLCVFFMISFKFKQLEGRFDAWLPQTTGLHGPPNGTIDLLGEVRIALFWDEANQRTVRLFGTRRVDGDEELGRLLSEVHADATRPDKPVPPATIDAQGAVPWQDVVDVVNACKKSRIDKIEFAFGPPPDADPGTDVPR